MVKPYVPVLLGVSAIVLFIYFFVHQKEMSKNQPLLLDMAANYIVNIFFLLVIAMLMT